MSTWARLWLQDFSKPAEPVLGCRRQGPPLVAASSERHAPSVDYQVFPLLLQQTLEVMSSPHQDTVIFPLTHALVY